MERLKAYSALCIALYREANNAHRRIYKEIELLAMSLALAGLLSERPGTGMREVAEAFHKCGGIPQPEAVIARLPIPREQAANVGEKTPGLGRKLYEQWRQSQRTAARRNQ